MVYLPNHDHCKYCGDPVKFGEKYCDDDCEQLFIAQQKSERKKDIIFYGGIALSLIVIFVVGVIVRNL